MQKLYDVSDLGSKEEFGNLASLREKFGDLVADKLNSLLPDNTSIWLTYGQIDDLDLLVKGVLQEKFSCKEPNTTDQVVLISALLPVAIWLVGLQFFQKS